MDVKYPYCTVKVFLTYSTGTKIHESIANGTVILQEHQQHANNDHVLDLECAPNLHV